MAAPGAWNHHRLMGPTKAGTCALRPRPFHAAHLLTPRQGFPTGRHGPGTGMTRPPPRPAQMEKVIWALGGCYQGSPASLGFSCLNCN